MPLMALRLSECRSLRAVALCIAAGLLGAADATGTAYAAESRAATSSTALLDGMSFAARNEVTKSDDRLMFRGGRFISEACIPFGFAESPYWVRTEGDKIHFLAEIESPTHGKMLWRGTVSGDNIDASYLWTKERWYWTIRREYRLRGVRQK